MDKRIFLLLLLSVFFIGFASANEICLPDSFKQSSNVNLIQTCTDCTYVNVTSITYPDGRIDNLNYEMTKINNRDWEYVSLNGSYTYMLGKYYYTTCGDIPAENKCQSVCFNVTPSGKSSNSIFFFIFILLIILTFVAGFYLENRWIMTFGSILVLFLGFYIIINGIDVIKDTTTTWAIGLVVWALGIYFLFLSIQEHLKEYD